MDETAEEVLRRFQKQMREQAETWPLPATFAPTKDEDTFAAPADSAQRPLLHRLEETWGASATQAGRWLDELLQGSAAWEIIERPLPGRKKRGEVPPLLRFREIGHCEPLLRIMRESGELAERERLLQARDHALRAIARASAFEAERHQAAGEIYDGYLADIARLATVYRPMYQEMRRALGTIPSLIGPRVRSHPFLQPPLMTRLFMACHADKSKFFAPPRPLSSGENAFGFANEYRRGRQAVTIQAGSFDDLNLLDGMAWDVAAVAVCAFFARTTGRDPTAQFPFLIDDYFGWRGVDSRKRTRQAREQIDARVRLLCSSERLLLDTQSELWRVDSQSGAQPHRSRMAVNTQGGFLIRRSGLFRPAPWVSETENEPLFGYLLSLGEWAGPFIEAGAMVGVFPKRLAEYDLRRQQWERRIGWYLSIQMQNQGAKMTFQKGAATGENEQNGVLNVTPQHSLKMRTVFENSHVPWEEMARTNPGKVIRQWVETLETLRRDGVIGDYSCLDGAVDGSDLPTRNRLGIMLNHRYLFTPGEDLAERLRHKSARRSGGRAGSV